jgi:hypothetical protein
MFMCNFGFRQVVLLLQKTLLLHGFFFFEVILLIEFLSRVLVNLTNTRTIVNISMSGNNKINRYINMKIMYKS